MNGMSQYGAVATKIKGMRGHLLNHEDYSRLAHSSSVKELVVYLKGNPAYAQALEKIDPDNMRRDAFERQLTLSAIRDIKKISFFLDRKRKEFMRTYANVYEMRIINNVIRSTFNKYKEPINFDAYRTLYSKYFRFDFNKAVEAKTIDELIDALQGSIYYLPLAKTREAVESPELFDYETALNRFHFKFFWDQLDKLKLKNDRKTLLESHGTEIDFLNIIWIYRTKAYYKVSPQDIYKYVIPAYHKLKYSQIARMIAADSVESMMAVVAETYYRKFLDINDPSSIVRAYKEQIANINERNRKKFPYSFAVIEAYIYDKQNEIERIVHIAECVRYGYDPKLIMEALDL